MEMWWATIQSWFPQNVINVCSDPRTNAMKVEYQSVWLEGLLLCMYFRIMSSAEMVFTQKAKKCNKNNKSLKYIFVPHGENFGFLNYISKVSKNLGSQDSQPHGVLTEIKIKKWCAVK